MMDDTGVDVTERGTVTLTVKDTDLAQVLEMLAIQSRRNIITSKNVSATVTANLYDVTFYEALKAILIVNGYDFIEEGNFIYVHTIEEIAEMAEARRMTESRIFTLDYLSASDANEFIAPLLSEVGQSAARGDVERGMQPGVDNGGEDTYAFEAKLVVNDYPENLDQVSSLLDELDTAPQQVMVEATILSTSLDESNAFGVDFTVLGNIDFNELTNPLAAVNSLISGDDPTSGFQPDDNEGFALVDSAGGTAGPGTLKVGVIADEIAVFLRVLDEVTDSTVLARPKIMCLNRQRAEVLVGARVGYLSTTATETTTTQSVEFLDTGIQLIFRPFVSRNGMVRLELSPSVSEASLRTVTDANGLIVTIPDELTNELTTNVRVQDGQTLVLGGLFRESTTVTRRQVPLLGDIPLIGAAFRGQDDAVGRSEIIFLITPTIIQDEAMWAMGNEVLDYTRAAQLGARDGLLNFSREAMTSNYNQRATAAWNRGDTEMALFYANNSLRLDSSQPEIVQFRERVTGVRGLAHEESIMDRAMHRETSAHLARITAVMEAQRRSGAPSSSGDDTMAGTDDGMQGPASGDGDAAGSASSNADDAGFDAFTEMFRDVFGDDPAADANADGAEESGSVAGVETSSDD